MTTPINHGFWASYTPDEFTVDKPSGAAYTRRDGDGVDWYEYVHPKTNFQVTSVKLTVQLDPDTGLNLIRAPYVEADHLFPKNAMIIELPGDYTGYTQDELIAMFSTKVIDLDTGEISDRPPPPIRLSSQGDVIAEILSRLDKLEGKK